MHTTSQEHQERTYSRQKRTMFYLIIMTFWLGILSLLIVGSVVYRTRAVYEDIKTSQRGWRGKVHQTDAALGFAPVPDSQGAEVFPSGPEVPMRFDHEGFRIPVAEPPASSPRLRPRPLVLTLGCSFTYGAANTAEETYPYLVGQSLGGTTKNAGVCSYGLAQMLIQAQRLIPSQRPDYVIVQYSPWLTERAQHPFAPTYFGQLPVPFFYGDSELSLHPPVFATKSEDMPVDGYRTSPKGMLDFVSFLWHVGLPLYLYDDFNMGLYHGKRMLGLIPQPTAHGTTIEHWVYKAIAKVARAHEAKVLVVILGYTSEPIRVAAEVFPEDVLVVDGQAALLARLPLVNDATYYQHYAHWRGVPPQIVDTHPNAAAHRLIAEAIVATLTSRPASAPPAYRAP